MTNCRRQQVWHTHCCILQDIIVCVSLSHELLAYFRFKGIQVCNTFDSCWTDTYHIFWIICFAHVFTVRLVLLLTVMCDLYTFFFSSSQSISWLMCQMLIHTVGHEPRMKYYCLLPQRKPIAGWKKDSLSWRKESTAGCITNVLLGKVCEQRSYVCTS